MFCAYYLLRKGYEVTIIDKNSYGLTSRNNAGLLTPSLTPTPKMNNIDIIKALTIGAGAISIDFSRVLKDPMWFIKAAKYINKETKIDKLVELGKDSLKLYNKFLHEEKIDVDLKKGVTALYRNDADAKFFAKKYNGEFIDANKINIFGYSEFNGGIMFNDELSVNPFKLFEGLRQKIIELGAEGIFGRNAEFEIENNKIKNINIGNKKIYADIYIAAAGSWSNKLLKPIKINPYIEPARGFSILFETKNRNIVSAPALLEDYGVAVAQHSSNILRATSFFELKGINSKFNNNKKEWLLNILKKHLKNYKNLKINKTYYGFRPCTPNNIPFIGKSQKINNLLIATGQCRLGITLAPITGKIIAELIEGNPIKKYAWLNQFVRN